MKCINHKVNGLMRNLSLEYYYFKHNMGLGNRNPLIAWLCSMLPWGNDHYTAPSPFTHT